MRTKRQIHKFAIICYGFGQDYNNFPLLEHTIRIQDINEQYQVKRAKLADGFTLALQKKDEVSIVYVLLWNKYIFTE